MLQRSRPASAPTGLCGRMGLNPNALRLRNHSSGKVNPAHTPSPNSRPAWRGGTPSGYFSYNVRGPPQPLRPTSEVSSAPAHAIPHSRLFSRARYLPRILVGGATVCIGRGWRGAAVRCRWDRVRKRKCRWRRNFRIRVARGQRLVRDGAWRASARERGPKDDNSSHVCKHLWLRALLLM